MASYSSRAVFASNSSDTIENETKVTSSRGRILMRVSANIVIYVALCCVCPCLQSQCVGAPQDEGLVGNCPDPGCTVSSMVEGYYPTAECPWTYLASSASVSCTGTPQDGQHSCRPAEYEMYTGGVVACGYCPNVCNANCCAYNNSCPQCLYGDLTRPSMFPSNSHYLARGGPATEQAFPHSPLYR